MKPVDVGRIATTLEESGEIYAVEVGQLDDGTPFLAGTSEVGSDSVSLRVELTRPFPARPPQVYLDGRDSLGRPLPHVDATGEVCFTARESVLLDIHRPGDLVVEAVRRAKAVLESGLAGASWDDYADEFEAHWRQDIDGVVSSVVEPGTAVVEIVALEHGESTTLAREGCDLDAFLNKPQPPSTRRCGLFIPLATSSAITPVPACLDARELRNLIWTSLSDSNVIALRRILRNRSKRSDYVILQVPRPAGDPALVGLLIEGMGRTHALLPGGDAQTITRLRLQRWDHDYLLRRGGASPEHSQRSVCVVGCGAVGSRIVDELAHAGVSNLLLVDPDKLSPDNTYRHLLGRQYWGKGKATAIAEWLTADVPYVRVSPHDLRFDEITDRVPKENLAALDMIIFATGDESAELSANETLRGEHRPPMLFTWLEPLGIGGHALLSLPSSAGCFECLHTDANGHLIENRAAFAAPGQVFTRDIRGCGSAYKPFSNLDAVRTASLACELMFGYFEGDITRPVLRSWKGERRFFENAGLHTSSRYDAMDAVQSEYTFSSPMCPVCGQGRVFDV